MYKMHFFLMFGRQARLPVYIILGIPHTGPTVDTNEFTQSIRDNKQLAFEIARHKVAERVNKQRQA